MYWDTIISLLTLACRTSLQEQDTNKSYKKFTLLATENKSKTDTGNHQSVERIISNSIFK